jgi:hypothetical protein
MSKGPRVAHERVGKRIREARKMAGLSQKQNPVKASPA